MTTCDLNQATRVRNLPGAWRNGVPRSAERGHPVLATLSARLRALLPDDRARLVEILAHHSHTFATIDEPHALDLERADRWIDSRVAEERMGYALHWAVCLLSNEELVGYVGLHDIDLERHHAELCFWLEPFPKSGEVMLEAAQTALAFAFTNLNMVSMRALSTPNRNGAAQLLIEIGMQLLQPARSQGTYWTRFDDVNIWTLTRPRWQRQLRITRQNHPVM